MSRVTVLGLGAMGSRMAISLLKAGHEVTVWNRNAAKCTELVSAGARSEPSPREAVAKADVAISMVRDDEASQVVWLKDGTGALAGLPKTAVAIESSTLSVNWAQQLGLACKQAEIEFLDAPVAGSRPQADAGQLIYLVGGDAEALLTAEPVLKAMGAAMHHAGPVGSGTAVKLAINALFGVQLATLAELIGILQRSDVDVRRALDIITSTPVCSPATKVAAGAMLAENFDPMFPIELVEKDFKYTINLALSNGASAPMADAALCVFSRAVSQGLGSRNITGIVQSYRS